MGKRKKKLSKQVISDMEPYIPCPIPEAYKSTPLMEDAEWRKVARLQIRLKRLIDTN
ncbi:hypothetical protein SLURMMXVI_10044 [Escherichia phage vB_Eco_SLUR63]|nr:hypothetical protein SLURMMXVI_140021 [Escherichia phage vB_Eco_SLUR25]VAY27835.1 hypothetical protein SLURMMXVI_10044 [Escherichia phage vB_Eco_SLUR63]